MKHPHYEMIVAWAADPSRVVQYRNKSDVFWTDCGTIPAWEKEYEYRFKPEPKPDVVQYLHMHERGINWFFLEPTGKPNLCLTFSGEDGRLLKAEVI